MSISTTTIAAFFTVVLLFAATRVTEAQPPCAAALTPCFPALNGTDPTTDCCTAMRTVFRDQLPCLCGLYNNPTLVNSLRINVTRALELPSHCNISNNTSICNTASAPGPSTQGTGGRGRPNGVGTISWTAMPAILMVWAITYLY